MANFDEDETSDKIEDRRGEESTGPVGEVLDRADGKMHDVISATKNKVKNIAGYNATASKGSLGDQAGINDFADGGTVDDPSDTPAIPEPGQQDPTQDPTQPLPGGAPATTGGIPDTTGAPPADQQNPPQQSDQPDQSWRGNAMKAIQGAINYGRQKFGLDQGGAGIQTPDQTGNISAYLSGAGAADPNTVETAEHAADPEGALSEHARHVKAVGSVAQQDPDAAFQMLQYDRKAAMKWGMFSIVAAAKDDIQAAASAATKAFAQIPSKWETVVTPVLTGGNRTPEEWAAIKERSFAPARGAARAAGSAISDIGSAAKQGAQAVGGAISDAIEADRQSGKNVSPTSAKGRIQGPQAAPAEPAAQQPGGVPAPDDKTPAPETPATAPPAATSEPAPPSAPVERVPGHEHITGSGDEFQITTTDPATDKVILSQTATRAQLTALLKGDFEDHMNHGPVQRMSSQGREEPHGEQKPKGRTTEPVITVVRAGRGQNYIMHGDPNPPGGHIGDSGVPRLNQGQQAKLLEAQATRDKVGDTAQKQIDAKKGEAEVKRAADLEKEFEIQDSRTAREHAGKIVDRDPSKDVVTEYNKAKAQLKAIREGKAPQTPAQPEPEGTMRRNPETGHIIIMQGGKWVDQQTKLPVNK